ncbi:hypothetical protein [Streptomyces griseus]|uniref:hypothetical protein n=1 Tax=Streptomyces griseus TaxID=1911 RepID=UPI00055E6EF1|nr:hypothetical protein [Streptomyces griseus]
MTTGGKTYFHLTDGAGGDTPVGGVRRVSGMLAYKGMDGIPLWLSFGIVVIAFVAFAVGSRRKK